MKIGVISDIHGNDTALSVVLKSARKNEVEHLLVLGDLVGYYYYPERVLKMLSEWKYDLIRGNHENILFDIIDGVIDSAVVKEKYGSGHQEALHKLSSSELDFLRALPESKSVKMGGVSFLLCHGAPLDPAQYIYPDAPETDLVRCNSNNHDFVLAGHTHYSFSYRNTHSTFLNPGSVGQSRQIGGMASWAIINTDNKSFQLLSSSYDTTGLKKDIASLDPDNENLLNVLNRE